MTSRPRSSAGFSLIEVAIVLVILGILLAFAVPTFASYRKSSQLKGASLAVAGQLRRARSAALGSGEPETVRFASDGGGAYVRVLSSTDAVQTRLPRGIAWGAGTPASLVIGSDGRASSSSYVVLADARGLRDTVSVQVSGLVLLQ